MTDGDDEYRRGNRIDTVWRDVVICDVSEFVRVHGSKLVLPKSIKVQIHQQDLSLRPETSSMEVCEEMTQSAVISLQEINTVINSTRVAQNMVSMHSTLFNVIQRYSTLFNVTSRYSTYFNVIQRYLTLFNVI